MSANSKIQWTDHTVNFVIGCVKVDELCVHCYADEMDARRFSKTLPGTSKESPIRHFGLNAPRYLRIEQAKADLLALDRAARRAGRIDKVFINSLSDTFESRLDLEGARLALFNKVDECQNLIFQILTKRPENVTRMVPEWWLTDNAWPKNAWIGTSVGNQRTADLRIPELLKIPAHCRFISYEPALGPVNFNQAESPLRTNWLNRIDWIIVGGESGPKARPFNVQWARDTVSQCKSAGVACFVKQLGARPVYIPLGCRSWSTPVPLFPALKDKKGGDPSEWEKELQVREFPKVGTVAPRGPLPSLRPSRPSMQPKIVAVEVTRL
jgi:protein gp37